MAKTRKLDIFDVLSAIDSRDKDFLSKQTVEAQKEFSPRVVLRWASTVNDPDIASDYLILFNEVVNKDLDNLADHPDLQYKLMASCGVGVSLRHSWLEMPKINKTPKLLYEFLCRFWPRANTSEIELIQSQFTRASFVDFVDGSGVSSEENKSLIDAFDKISNK